MTDFICLLVAWKNQEDLFKTNHPFDYFCCERSAMKATKKYLLNHGYQKIRTCTTIPKDQLEEVKSALKNNIEICETVCTLIKSNIEQSHEVAV